MKNTIILLLFMILLGNIYCKKSLSDRERFERTINNQNTYNETKNKENIIDYEKYFVNGNIINGVRIISKKIGNINIRSNKLIACDPFYVDQGFTAPFSRDVPVGSYPVFITYVDLKDWGRSVAFVKIQFKKDKTVKYEKAIFKSKNRAIESEYGVDSGMGSIMDLKTAGLFASDQQKFEMNNKNADYYTSIIEPQLQDDSNWANLYINNKTSNLFVFQSGLGDGSYTSYWGVNSKGGITSFITDFSIFTLNGTIED